MMEKLLDFQQLQGSVLIALNFVYNKYHRICCTNTKIQVEIFGGTFQNLCCASQNLSDLLPGSLNMSSQRNQGIC